MSLFDKDKKPKEPRQEFAAFPLVFPVKSNLGHVEMQVIPGMSIRQYAAIQLLSGLIGGGGMNGIEGEVELAIRATDVLLKRLSDE